MDEAERRNGKACNLRDHGAEAGALVFIDRNAQASVDHG